MKFVGLPPLTDSAVPMKRKLHLLLLFSRTSILSCSWRRSNFWCSTLCCAVVSSILQESVRDSSLLTLWEILVICQIAEFNKACRKSSLLSNMGDRSLKTFLATEAAWGWSICPGSGGWVRQSLRQGGVILQGWVRKLSVGHCLSIGWWVFLCACEYFWIWILVMTGWYLVLGLKHKLFFAISLACQLTRGLGSYTSPSRVRVKLVSCKVDGG